MEPDGGALSLRRRVRVSWLAALQGAVDRAGPLARTIRDRLPASTARFIRMRAAPVRLAPSARDGDATIDPIDDPRRLATPMPRWSGAPRAAVVVPTRGGVYLASCLAALDGFTAEGALEVVVVDDGAPAEAAAWLARRAQGPRPFRVVTSGRNRGFAAAVNHGARHASAPVLVVLNDDAIVTPGWLDALLAHLGPGVGLVGPATNESGDVATAPASYASLDALLAHARARASTRAGASRSADKLSLLCAALPRATFESLGGLDEGYGLGMFEDDDLCEALRARDLEVRLAEDVWVHHAAGTSLRALSPRVYMTAFECGRARFERKWGRRWRPAPPAC